MGRVIRSNSLRLYSFLYWIIWLCTKKFSYALRVWKQLAYYRLGATNTPTPFSSRNCLFEPFVHQPSYILQKLVRYSGLQMIILFRFLFVLTYF